MIRICENARFFGARRDPPTDRKSTLSSPPRRGLPLFYPLPWAENTNKKGLALTVIPIGNLIKRK